MTEEIKKELDKAIGALLDFCDESTCYTAECDFSHFPVKMTFVPNVQQTFYQNNNLSDVVIEVGLITEVKTAFLGTINADILKKIIKLTKKVAELYYMYFTCIGMSSTESAEDSAEREENE